MSSGEEDYMSDAFLTKTVEDVRPGLIKNRGKIRENQIEAKKMRFDDEQRQRFRPLKQLEAERRDEGLGVAITSDNKGFAMLAKMGYKQGEAIGKTATGIVEPIGIQIKVDRGGLGRDAALRQLKERRAEIRRVKLLEYSRRKEHVSTEEFRRRMTQKSVERQLESDLGKCQRACERLDMDESIEAPAMAWFWPNRVQPEAGDTDDINADEASDKEKNASELNEESDEHEPEDTEEDEVEYETSEKLEMLLDYLRTTYCYCHWCGIKYEHTDDMQANCPGQTKDDH